MRIDRQAVAGVQNAIGVFSDAVESSWNRPSVTENWQPKVGDLASMRVPDANAGQAVAPRSNSANAIGCVTLSLQPSLRRALANGVAISTRWLRIRAVFE
jgi:hypothetical protein